MFKNCVLNASVDTKKWIKASAIRAVKTMAQTAVAIISTGTVLGDVNWIMTASASARSGSISILTRVAGMPEVGGSDNE